MPVYDATPVGELRRRIGADAFARLGDAGKTVDAMIVASDAERPARRLTLGSSAYQSISKALAVRLAELEAQKSVALEADVAES